MKIINLLVLLFCGIFYSSNSNAQLNNYHLMIDTLLTDTIKHGFMFWQENDFEPGECFQQYRIIADDYDNNVVLKNTMVDSMIYMTHYHYGQTYKGVPVEGGFASEHFDINDKLIYTNARFAIELDRSVTPQLSEQAAKQSLLNSFPSQYVMAWDDSNWENALKSELGDPSATYEPTGELILALDNCKNLDFYVPASRYRLAYKFDVLMLSPDKYATFYVDANTGVVFKELSLDYHDGIANITNTGNRTIDTRERGFPNFDFVLETDNAGIKIHTKKYSTEAWILRGEIDKNDEPWDYHEDKATTAHWYATQTWIFYRDYFAKHGADGNNGNVRVHVENSSTNGTETKYRYLDFSNTDNLTFDHYDGYSTGNYLDVVAHEFTHGIVRHSLSHGLASADEPGALNESFADIFGLMAERYTIAGEIESSTDWLTSIPGPSERSLSDPKSHGLHNTPGCGKILGQPDTYQGEFWTEYDCPTTNGDKHAKSGVQNHWFYLLSEGGSGINDNDDNYNVTGIGENDAIRIVWFALMINGNYELQYSESREAMAAAAYILYGPCSNQYHQTVNAWYAVGVGGPSHCTEVLSVESNETEVENSCIIYPNPIVDNQATINWENHENYRISLFDLNGKLISNYFSTNSQVSIELPQISKGVYLLTLTNEASSINRKIIIQ